MTSCFRGRNTIRTLQDVDAGGHNQLLDSLEKDHEFLTHGGVFTDDLIETWIHFKRSQEVDYVRLRPHPAEFELYYDL